ncbi:helix-turn-helix transcriptional regulator [Devosia nitrariae]|uniref:helix-turn-helix transcriptional regulator n=1 Tax=Devosia nitrariae TaxID=2071872 RepID=UPI0024E18336|nr:helix-turn-helix transcriptional regulator [Devosia nitrariae]
MVDPSQIRAARALLNWTQAELAKRAGTSRRSITTIESESSVLASETMLALVKALEAAGIEFTSSEGRRGVSGPAKMVVRGDRNSFSGER